LRLEKRRLSPKTSARKGRVQGWHRRIRDGFIGEEEIRGNRPALTTATGLLTGAEGRKPTKDNSPSGEGRLIKPSIKTNRGEGCEKRGTTLTAARLPLKKER